MVKIRCARGGRKKSPFYRIVVVDSRSPRDGKYIERIGHINQLMENFDGCELNIERLEYWLSVGAQMSPKVKSLYKVAKKQAS